MGDSAPIGALWQVWVFVVFMEENTVFLNHKETAAILGYKTRQLEHLRLTYDKGCAPDHTYINRKIAYSEEELIRWTKLQRDNAIEAAERRCAERLERLAEFINDNAPLEAA